MNFVVNKVLQICIVTHHSYRLHTDVLTEKHIDAADAPMQLEFPAEK